jgi:uncharacterized protein (DUF2141 family)
MRLFVVATLSALCLGGAANAADTAPAVASLAITVHNISDAGGDIRLGVYDETSFAQKGGVPVAHTVKHARGATMTLTLDDVPPGTYGVKVLQDLNRNGQFDMGLKGIEPFGFSNDPEIQAGLPPFDAVKFTVTAGNNSIDITLH